MARSIKPFIFNRPYNGKLDLSIKNTGLYFHIPFCKMLCPFCPYYKVKYDRELMKEFIHSLKREIKLIASLTESKKEIESIYFGGGTPALAIDYIPEIINLTKDLFKLRGDMGIELHPRDVNRELLGRLKNCGFNMISIGIQSFHDTSLSELERERIDNKAKLRMLKDFNFEVIDVDLIFGIPGQSSEELTGDFKTAAENGATQISTYPFIEFTYSELKNKPLGKKEKKKMLGDLADTGKKLGYRRSSIWTFSKGEKLQYSSVTRDNYIGFGPSAATLLEDIFKVNTFSVREYIKKLNNNKMPTALTFKFTLRQRALYWLFWSAYRLYIDADNFYKLFGRKLEDMFGRELYIGKKLGYLEKCSGGYRLTEKGAYTFHLVEQTYTRQYIDKTWRSSLTDPWPKRITLY
ncbi:MAG: radical SAM protein [Actinomycetota bacterium]|nr:radical SAM protein [Actinomycetota bacterium]